MGRRHSQGFTIIEALIVLAMASFIMMIIFLAIPALQRTKNNTLRRRDVSFIASQRVQYNLDNQTAIVLGGYDCSLPLTTKLFCTYLAKSLTYYDLDNVTFHNSGATPPTTIPTITDLDHVLTDTYFKCNDDGSTVSVAQNARYMIVLYAIETTAGPVQQCYESSVFPS